MNAHHHNISCCLTHLFIAHSTSKHMHKTIAINELLCVTAFATVCRAQWSCSNVCNQLPLYVSTLIMAMLQPCSSAHTFACALTADG